jgi:hypothetical protein
LAVGDDREKAAVGLLAKKKIESDRKKGIQRGPVPATDLEGKPTSDLLGLAKLNLKDSDTLLALAGEDDGRAAINLLAQGKKKRETEQQQQGGFEECPTSDGLFYAYAVQSSSPHNRYQPQPGPPKYTYTFGNPAIANAYFGKAEKKFAANREFIVPVKKLVVADLV